METRTPHRWWSGPLGSTIRRHFKVVYVVAMRFAGPGALLLFVLLMALLCWLWYGLFEWQGLTGAG